MATMKELEGWLDELDQRLARLEGAPAPAGSDEDLEARDRALLTRFATTREEALEQEAARARMADRGLEGPDWVRTDEAPAEESAASPETPPE